LGAGQGRCRYLGWNLPGRIRSSLDRQKVNLNIILIFIENNKMKIDDILCRLKSSQIVMGMAVMAALIGVILIGLASWSIDGYQELIADCNAIIISLLKICEWTVRHTIV
jgi:hypothetical protein